MPNVSKTRLRDIIKARSFSTGSNVKLASGRTSNFYFNMKPTMLDPEGAALIGELALAAIADLDADYIGGLEMGAVPLATAVAIASHKAGKRLPAFFVRKQPKDHGAEKLVEGLAPGETLQGKRVIIIEDVTTTGGSSMKAIDAVRKEGGEVACVLTIVERKEGAVESFAAAKIPFRAVLTVDDFA
jgi:orotate phosphoribosyltransferase